MRNAELFLKAMVAGAGFTAGAIAVLFLGLVIVGIIACIAEEERKKK